MLHPVIVVGLILCLFGGVLAAVELGRRAARGRKVEGLTAVEGAVFGLMGLLMAFTFGSAAVRFETRRNLIVEEANNIGTAYLRLDLLPESAQPALRDAFREYVDTRLAIYRLLPDIDAAKAELEHMADLQSRIWHGATHACHAGAIPSAPLLLLPALNSMFDIATTRTVAIRTHQPTAVFIMLAIVMLVCALLAGFSMSVNGRSWLHVLSFAIALTLAYYVILDLEYPRIGLIRIDWMDRVLEDVRRDMGPVGT